MNRYNAPEVLSALFRALQAAGLEDVVGKLKQMGVPRLINDAWMDRDKTAAKVAARWLVRVASPSGSTE